MKTQNSFTNKSLEENIYKQTGLRWRPLLFVTQNWSVLEKNPFTHKLKTKAMFAILFIYNQSYPRLSSHNTENLGV